MRKGFDAVQESFDRKGSGGGNFLRHLTWEGDASHEDNTHLLRFLPEEVITASFYNFVKCDDGSTRAFIVPSSVGIDEPDFFQIHNLKLPNFQKQLVKAKPQEQTIGLAALREEKIEMVDGRKTLTVVDKIVTREYEKDGETKTFKGADIRIIKMSSKNFWANLIKHNARYGGIHDRDFSITRFGKGTDTTYSFDKLDQIEGLITADEVNARYTPPQTLEEWVMERLATPAICEELLGSMIGKRVLEDKRAKDGDKVETVAHSNEDAAADEAQVSTGSGSQMGSLRDTLVNNR